MGDEILFTKIFAHIGLLAIYQKWETYLAQNFILDRWYRSVKPSDHMA